MVMSLYRHRPFEVVWYALASPRPSGIVPSVRQLPPSGRALMYSARASLMRCHTRTSMLAVSGGSSCAMATAPTTAAASATSKAAIRSFGFTQGSAYSHARVRASASQPLKNRPTIMPTSVSQEPTIRM